MEQIFNIEQFKKSIEQNESVLFYFSSKECNVCKSLKPKIEDLISKKFEKIKTFYIDIQESPEISGQNTVFSIPTILIFFDKKETIRVSRNIGISELSEMIERYYRLFWEF